MVGPEVNEALKYVPHEPLISGFHSQVRGRECKSKCKCPCVFGHSLFDWISPTSKEKV